MGIFICLFCILFDNLFAIVSQWWGHMSTDLIQQQGKQI